MSRSCPKDAHSFFWLNDFGSSSDDKDIDKFAAWNAAGNRKSHFRKQRFGATRITTTTVQWSSQSLVAPQYPHKKPCIWLPPLSVPPMGDRSRVRVYHDQPKSKHRIQVGCSSLPLCARSLPHFFEKIRLITSLMKSSKVSLDA